MTTSHEHPVGGAEAATRPFPPLRDRLARRWRRLTTALAADPGRAAEAAVSVLAVVVATALVLVTLHPDDLWRDTTPTGGDMGAHVWGPRYLLDHLLPHWRLSGWTPDWYNGFPAYQFYMVVPSLLIVALHVGLAWWAAVPVVVAALAAVVVAWARPRLHPYRFVVLGVAALVVLLAVAVPYNRSFKLITAVGLLGLPLACWAFAKLADLPFPAPPLAAGASLLFLYNREPLYNNTGNIIGGNFQSTMAGEFAFSISLTLSVLYLGVAARGLRTGKHRALAAALFALAGLCHLIPAFFVLACTAALFVVHPDRARFRWLATMVPVAGALTAFWVLPFWWRRDYVNDMGWERLPVPNSEQASVWYYLLPSGMRWLMVAAVLGLVVSLVRRYSVGLVLGIAWAAVMVAFAWLPQARLWNARLLPFMYLSVALLAAIGVGEVIRFLASVASGRPERPFRPVSVTLAVLAVAGVVLYAALPLSGLFEDQIRREAVTVDGETRTRSSWWIFSTTATNPVAGWSAWNYSGLEAKEANPAGCDAEGSTVPCTSGGWPEYRALMATMAELGADPDHGCGRAFWEYDQDRINGYGTPMAPMLLPYWTDGCIGSQEGLYFESSTTVPFHFLMQSELSAKPSQPQREIPYPGFDLDAGVEHLQQLGVTYYLAVSPSAVAAADQHPDLAPVATSGPWHVYEVADAPVVEPLRYEPVVARGMGEGQHDWLPTATAWFLDPDVLEVPVAVDGPSGWERVDARPVPDDWRRLVRWTREMLGFSGPIDRVPSLPRTELDPVEVSDVEMGRDRISFRVSEPGVPVLVKASYFPNWEVEGAEGPYRVTPNLMVVVPTQREVTLHYGRTPVDLLAAGVSVLGLVGLVLLARRPPLAVPPQEPGSLSRWIDDLVRVPRTATHPDSSGSADSDLGPSPDDAFWGTPDREAVGADAARAPAPDGPPGPAPAGRPHAPTTPTTGTGNGNGNGNGGARGVGGATPAPGPRPTPRAQRPVGDEVP